MIRPHEDTGLVQGGIISRIKRRQLLRIGFLTATLLATAELTGVLVPFIRVIKIEGLGAKIPAGKKADILAQFKGSKDEPILNTQGRFFLIHAPGAIAAAYRKCVHLGCAVPYLPSESQFHCPCHGSLYDRHGRVTGGPAPKPLDLMQITVAGDQVTVDTGKITTRSAYEPSQATKLPG